MDRPSKNLSTTAELANYFLKLANVFTDEEIFDKRGPAILLWSPKHAEKKYGNMFRKVGEEVYKSYL